MARHDRNCLNSWSGRCICGADFWFDLTEDVLAIVLLVGVATFVVWVLAHVA